MQNNHADARQTLTLYHRLNCHLCEEMLEALRHYADELQFDLAVYDIEEDQKLLSQFNELVPIVFIGDEELMRYELDLKALTTAVLI